MTDNVGSTVSISSIGNTLSNEGLLEHGAAAKAPKHAHGGRLM